MAVAVYFVGSAESYPLEHGDTVLDDCGRTTSLAVIPREAILSGSSQTRIAESPPPNSRIWPTPGMRASWSLTRILA
jgi:hypothetical protein